MTVSPATRPITPGERAELERLAGELPGARGRWKSALWITVGAFAGCALVLFLGWTIVDALSRGWLSANVPSALRVGLATCGGIALVSAIRWARRAEAARSRVKADLASGRVIEETLEFDAAKRFQEPEHGGLLYFLRTPDRRIYVVYDHESQDLGVAGKDPLDSAYRPRMRLRIVRTPELRTVIVRESSGVILDAGPPLPLALSPPEWPEDDEFYDVPWDELDERLGRGRR